MEIAQGIKRQREEAVFFDSPQEILYSIFKFLSPFSQMAATCVCIRWKKIGEDKNFKVIREGCFGKLKWRKHFGEIGEEPALPFDIETDLSSPCPFIHGKTVRETHFLNLIPETLDKQSFNLNLFQEYTGKKLLSSYDYFPEGLKISLGNSSFSTHWILIFKGMVPENKKNEYRYHTFPTVLEFVTANFSYYAETRKFFYEDYKLVHVKCAEEIDGGKVGIMAGYYLKNILNILCESPNNKEFEYSSCRRF